jgi:hypothetical protein
MTTKNAYKRYISGWILNFLSPKVLGFVGEKKSWSQNILDPAAPNGKSKIVNSARERLKPTQNESVHNPKYCTLVQEKVKSNKKCRVCRYFIDFNWLLPGQGSKSILTVLRIS